MSESCCSIVPGRAEGVRTRRVRAIKAACLDGMETSSEARTCMCSAVRTHMHTGLHLPDAAFAVRISWMFFYR